jgi:hypothetical protein
VTGDTHEVGFSTQNGEWVVCERGSRDFCAGFAKAKVGDEHDNYEVRPIVIDAEEWLRQGHECWGDFTDVGINLREAGAFALADWLERAPEGAE